MQVFGIIILIVVLGIISGSICYIFDKKKQNSITATDFIRYIVFFSLLNYFVLSMVKTILGSSEDTLLESFWDILPMTYIHYGIPLLILAIIFPIILKKIFKGTEIYIVRNFDFCISLLLIVQLLCLVTISNLNYVIVYAISIVFTIISVCTKFKELMYLEKTDYKDAVKKAISAIGLLVIMLGIYYPNELYLNNLGDFQPPYGQYFIILLLGSLLIGALIVACSMIFFPKKIYNLSLLVIFGVDVAGYLQSMFLNGKLQSLTGEEQVWQASQKAINIVIWLVIIGIIVFLGYKKETLAKLYRTVCIYIILIQIVTLGYLFITTDRSGSDSQAAMTTEGSLELAKGNNILIFILDRFDISVLQQLISEDEEFFEPLSDFTLYDNMTSEFSRTGRAIPYLLTCTPWYDGVEKGAERDYPDFAYSNSNLLETIKNQNYNIGLYSLLQHLPKDSNEYAVNYSDSVERNYDALKTMKTMWRTSLYRITPFAVKKQYSYYTSDISELVNSDDVWSIENDIPFYNSIVKTGLSINEDYENAFRFYHMRGAHEPFQMSEDLKYDSTGRNSSIYSQAKGSIKIVYEYLRQLKELGKYDDSLIIITADHGQGVEFDKETNIPENTSGPIFMMKQPNEKNDKMKVNDKPVSQAELKPTLIKAVGVDWKEYGKTFDEITDSDNEVRDYIDVAEDHIIQYEIRGNVNDLKNWSVKKAWFVK